MKIEVTETPCGEVYCIALTKEDLRNKTWRHHDEVVLKRKRTREGGTLYWRSEITETTRY